MGIEIVTFFRVYRHEDTNEMIIVIDDRNSDNGTPQRRIATQIENESYNTHST